MFAFVGYAPGADCSPENMVYVVSWRTRRRKTHSLQNSLAESSLALWGLVLQHASIFRTFLRLKPKEEMPSINLDCCWTLRLVEKHGIVISFPWHTHILLKWLHQVSQYKQNKEMPFLFHLALTSTGNRALVSSAVPFSKGDAKMCTCHIVPIIHITRTKF